LWLPEGGHKGRPYNPEVNGLPGDKMKVPAKLTRPMFIGVLLAGIACIWFIGPAPALQNQETPEIKSEETAPTFTVRAQRNEVLVRVVVRDKDGKAVGGLTKDDFRLSDNSKPQSVTLFKVETFAAAPAATPTSPSATAKPPAPPEAPPALALPQRYVAFYFDDLVVTFEDMYRTRAAAERYLDSSLQPADRAGIFTSSGLGSLDFTDDRTKLHEALAKLRPRPRTVRAENDCPPLTPYEAYLIDDQHDSIMLNIATWEYIGCACGGDPKTCADAQNQAQQAARMAWQNDQVQSRQCLHVLENLVRRLGALPGQRSILWLSQGFLALDLQSDLGQLIDRALREHVVISALDARGLWVDIPGGDASEGTVLPFNASGGPGGGTDPSMLARQAMYRRTGKEMNDDVMAYVSHDTGGVFVHNTNDYDGGFRRAGALPEITYLLAFSPQNLKYDGKFHKLKVELVSSKGLTVQARNGYFAPNQELRPEERAKQEIDGAVFARDEYLEFPVDVHTQFFKLSDTKVQLSVTARVDVHALRFHKEGDRNRLNLKMVCVAFDRDGNLVDGTEKEVNLMLRDATLAHLLSSGLSIRDQLKVNVGNYALRVVVYEIDSARMTALNRTVEIPY
jgi:VWFA-related protein